VVKVRQTPDLHTLHHGITQHGSQFRSGERALQPTSYYHRQGPLGDVVPSCQTLTGCRDVGVVGLGVGTMAAYGRAGDRMTFYEIDPLIVRVAEDRRLFTYLSRSQAKVDIVLGDGRLSLADSTRRHDLLVIDAFSSDAIPTHLLTSEAITQYMDRLSDKGLLAVHISNRHINLQPVLKAAARDAGIAALVRVGNASAPDTALLPSTWVVLARDRATLNSLPAGQWKPLSGPDIKPWTDDYSNLLNVLK
jgi:spermidine synthase